MLAILFEHEQGRCTAGDVVLSPCGFSLFPPSKFLVCPINI